MSELNEFNFQKFINSQEEWEEVIFNEGLQVIDIYQDWCNFCKPISKFLWRLKTELNDKLLIFSVAKTNNIDSLERYRGRCEPCFLIYGNGILVGVIRGCNPPRLEKLIKLKLKEEHLAITGIKERIEIKDPFFKYLEELQLEEQTAKDYEESFVEIALVIIKPDIVLNKKISEIISLILKENIIILKEDERLITEEEAEALYVHLQDAEFYNSLIKYITSGSSYFLILMKDNNIINYFRTLLGPKCIEESKQLYPESIRAIYGKSTMENAVHCGDDKEVCDRELSIFYPDFIPPLVKLKRDIIENTQITLAIIRPSAFRDFKEKIIQCIIDSEFKILRQQEFKFIRNEAEMFYSNSKNDDYFEDLILEMIDGPFLVLSLSRKDAVNRWRTLIGNKDLSFALKYEPRCLRAVFSRTNVFVNLLHGSESVELAEKELKYFFPVEQTIAAIKPDSFDNKDEILELIIEFGFKISITKEILLSKDQISNIYKPHIQKPYFSDLLRYMSSGKSLFLVLSKENAIKEWRNYIGPTDPEIAVEENPDYLRALYGRDILENAIFGCVNKDEVNETMELIFGDVKFNEDGSVIVDDKNAESEVSMNSFERSLKQQSTILVEGLKFYLILGKLSKVNMKIQINILKLVEYF